jgi:glycosyltransferase involved in cell wall biosynthesis
VSNRLADASPATLLIPTYNDRGALSRTLESIATSGDSVHVLVIDDGSDEPVGPLPKGIQVLRLEKNGGITAALNAGLDYAQKLGFEIAIRLDAGDGYVKGRVLKQVQFLRENPDVVLVAGAAIFRYSDPARTKLYVAPLTNEQIRRALRFYNPLIHPSVAFRISQVIGVGGYSSRFKHSEDYDLFMRLVREGKVASLGDPLVVYDIDPSSISGRNRKKQLLNGVVIKIIYFDAASLHSYLGLVHNLVRIVVPRAWGARIRRLFLANGMPSR